MKSVLLKKTATKGPIEIIDNISSIDEIIISI
jgi:hypothetical protein